jgi:hypothetical protein
VKNSLKSPTLQDVTDQSFALSTDLKNPQQFNKERSFPVVKVSFVDKFKLVSASLEYLTHQWLLDHKMNRFV